MTLTAWPIDEHPSDAEVIRQAYGSLVGAAGGLVASGGLAVSQKGTPAMAVLVAGGTPAEGGLWIPGYTATTGPTYFQNSATYEQPIEAAGASNPRIDTIVARVYDTNLDSSGKHEPVIEALRGKEETGVTLPAKKSSPAAVPKNCMVLAYVLVPSKAASIVTADIENVATPFTTASTSFESLVEVSTKVNNLSLKARLTPIGVQLRGRFLTTEAVPIVNRIARLPVGMRSLAWIGSGGHLILPLEVNGETAPKSMRLDEEGWLTATAEAELAASKEYDVGVPLIPQGA
jgi:hypothetical protein